MATVQERNSEMVGILSADLLSNQHMNLGLFARNVSFNNTFTGTFTNLALDTIQFNSTIDMYDVSLSGGTIGEITLKKKGIYFITGSLSARIETVPGVGVGYGPYVVRVQSQVDEGAGFGSALTMLDFMIPAWTGANISIGNASFGEIRWVTENNTKYRLQVQRNQGVADTLRVQSQKVTVVCLMMLD